MHISNAFQSPKGHVNYDFVDISLSTDTPLCCHIEDIHKLKNKRKKNFKIAASLGFNIVYSADNGF